MACWRSAMPTADVLRSLRNVCCAASLLQVVYSVRSERLLMEQLDYNLLFRWFVGLNVDDPVWDHSTFSFNRERLFDAAITQRFFEHTVLLASDAHFSVDGTLLEASTKLVACWDCTCRGLQTLQQLHRDLRLRHATVRAVLAAGRDIQPEPVHEGAHRPDGVEQLLCAHASSIGIRADACQHEHVRIGGARLPCFRADESLELGQIRFCYLSLDFDDVGALCHRPGPASLL